MRNFCLYYKGIGLETGAQLAVEHIPCFWQFVTSLSPRLAGSPARRQACSEPKSAARIELALIVRVAPKWDRLRRWDCADGPSYRKPDRPEVQVCATQKTRGKKDGRGKEEGLLM
jgi:hypothetical protein